MSVWKSIKSVKQMQYATRLHRHPTHVQKDAKINMDQWTGTETIYLAFVHSQSVLLQTFAD